MDDPIPFPVKGTTYHFRPPKMGPLIITLMEADRARSAGEPGAGVMFMRAMLDWIGAGLSEDEGSELLARLVDPDDELDILDLTEPVKELIEAAVGRPTLPPSA